MLASWRIPPGRRIQINLQDHDGDTALHWLTRGKRYNGERGIVEDFFRNYDELRKADLIDVIDMNIRNRNGCRPLDYAQSKEMRKVLKARGAKRGGLCRCRK